MRPNYPPTWQLLVILLIVLMFYPAQVTRSDASLREHGGGVYSPLDSKSKDHSSMPLAFTINQGQWDQDVKFRASVGGATMWFTSDGAHYQFTRQLNTAAGGQLRRGMLGIEPDDLEVLVLKASFVGANPTPQLRGVDLLEYKCNYFLGSDPEKWQTDVPNYRAVTYQEVYDGIDLKYYGSGSHLEYDFIVSPGADYSTIKVKYEGADSIFVNNRGELVVSTGWGDVVEQQPVVFQLDDGAKVPVEGKYLLRDRTSFGFEITNHNPALPLIIDPVLSYSTYLGNGSDDNGEDIAVDASGAAYITGYTYSANFPTFNPYLDTLQGIHDAFVTKLNSSGTGLIYSTYLGGDAQDIARGIAVDAAGAAYITGFTLSSDFPTQNPYLDTIQGSVDAFVTRLSSSGNSLEYSTYLGGGGSDVGHAIVADASGAAYITGIASSTDFPTVNAYEGTNQGGVDAFVTKLNSAGNNPVYSTYFGGSTSDYGYGVAVDSSGAAYVTGYSKSDDLPTVNPYQDTLSGTQSVFAIKLASAGNSLVYATYIGGSDADDARDIAIDQAGAAYITGETKSVDFPAVSSYQDTLGGFIDVFVTKVGNSGSSLDYSTYIGGSARDVGRSIAVDTAGAAYVTGFTYSDNFPTRNPYQDSLRGFVDVIAVKLSTSGSNLIYSTFLGGTIDEDFGYGIAVDDAGAAYVTGETGSTDFPTLNAYQGTFPGGGEAFVTKIGAVVSCCVGISGNVDADIDELVDIGDLTALISYLYIPPNPLPECPPEANIDGDEEGLIDIGDLTALISYLYIPPNAEPADCR
jgi:hypothetical protein